MQMLSRRVAVRTAVVGLAGFSFAVSATSAVAAGLNSEVFAVGGSSLSKPDDITSMKDSIYVAWQNGVGALGEPAPNGNTQSTVVRYSRTGAVINEWRLTGRCDGMTADRQRDRIIATVNEDGNSSLYVISPEAASASQLAHYAYSPNPPGHGGGTDAPHVYRGQIFISASNPSDTTQPAVYSAVLSGTTATLTPVFFDDSTATVANTNDPAQGTTVALALTDPDSNFVVPGSSPRFGGDFMLDSQGDGVQVYVRDTGTAGQQLFLLTLSGVGASTSVDDTVWATSDRGTLFATDGSTKVYALSGHFGVGTAFSAVTPGNANTPSSQPNFLATLDLGTGVLTPVAGVNFQPKGLVFVPGALGDGN